MIICPGVDGQIKKFFQELPEEAQALVVAVYMSHIEVGVCHVLPVDIKNDDIRAALNSHVEPFAAETGLPVKVLAPVPPKSR